jgi:chromate resistance exported protein
VAAPRDHQRRGEAVVCEARLIDGLSDEEVRGLFAPGELRFDMFQAEFTHQGDRCTFEVLLERATLDDPALRAIAEIVQDIDFKDAKFNRDEAACIASLIAASHGRSRGMRTVSHKASPCSRTSMPPFAADGARRADRPGTSVCE